MRDFIIVLFFIVFTCTISTAQDYDKLRDYRNPDKSLSLNYNQPINLYSLINSKTSNGVWTELNPNLPRVDYLGVHFVNPDTGWAVGAAGAIIRSTDGGVNWKTIASPVSNILLNVHSYNGQVVIATGYDGIILRSDDAGYSWQQISSGVTGDLWRVQMVNDTLGWICGLGPSLLKTTDAGLTWNPVNTGYASFQYWSLDFYNEDIGFIAGGDGNILKTTDGGNTWQHFDISSINEYSLYAIDVVTPNRIVAGGFAKVVTTTDGGNSWQATGISGTVNTIAFTDTLIGYEGENEGDVWKTTDGGITWQLNNWFPIYSRNWIMFLNDSLGFIAGSGLNVQKTTDGGNSWINVIMNDDFRDVCFLNEANGFVLTHNKLYKTTNYGMNWDRVPNAPGGSDLLFLDSFKGFIGSNTIYKTTNGGNSWYQVNINGATGNINKIFFVNSMVGWAVTSWSSSSNAKILNTSDGGENWSVQLEGLVDPFTSIFFIDILNGWATSRYVWQTTDGGVNWVEQNYLPSDSHDDVYFANKDTGWISHYSSINTSLFKTTDGGENWLDIDEVIGARKFYFFPDPIHWIILGFSRYYITNDGGNSWLEFTNDIPSGLSSFQASTNNLGFAVGGAGLILRYDDTSYVPVELTSLSATSEKGSVKLKWTTATETNNRGFEILRSTNNKNWDIVGFIPGNGSTTTYHIYQYKDEVKTAGYYYYKLKQIDYNGEFDFSNTIEVQVFPPSDFILYQNFPNPFNPITKITFEIPFPTEVRITLYDITGQEIKTITNQKYPVGFHSVVINADDLSSGVYLYRMTTLSGYTAVKKLTIIK